MITELGIASNYYKEFYFFRPQDNITVLEVAEIMAFLFNVQGHSLEKGIGNLSKQTQRHFVLEERE